MTPHNLPRQSTAFIGRDSELAEIAARLSDPTCRLLTLVGPGGIGKSRLALQVATNLAPYFADGIAFVPLAPVGSPELLPPAIASALDIAFFGSENPVNQIIHYLRDKQILLLMDNFEHLLDGADLLNEILQVVVDVKILITSRERLNLQEEWIFPLDGLSYPTEPTADTLANYSAVQLFVQRAYQMQPHFDFDQNAQAIVSICRQVEGMPLALELAASWLRAMTCQQIVAQMAHNLDFLTTPLRNIPERHRSLRMVFEQSWRFLSPDEQAVLMRLSVFRGGFDQEAAGEVAGASLFILAGLADKSLIRMNGSGRYDLHELLRQYAADKLSDAGDTINIANRHLEYFMKLAEAGEAHAYGREQALWYDRQETEMDNLRAALAWSLTNEEPESGLRMTAALRWVWEMRGHLSEGLVWCQRLLSASEDVSPAVRVKALQRASEVAWMTTDKHHAQVWSSEALKLARTLDDKRNLAWSLATLGGYIDPSQYPEETATMLEEGLILFRELEDPFGLSHALRRRAILASNHHDYPYAQMLLEEALARDRKAGDKNAVAWGCCIIGAVLWSRYRNGAQVAALYEESAALFGEIRDIHGQAYPMFLRADIERFQGNYEHSHVLYKEAILLLRGIGMDTDDGAVWAMAGMSSLAVVKNQFERAAKLLAALNDRIKTDLYHFSAFLDSFDTDLVSARTQLGEAAFEKAWAEGKAMTIEQAITYALQDEPTSMETVAAQPQHGSTQSLIEALSMREVEVLRLIAEGLSNAEIAQKLFLTVGTVKVHSRNIYGKLGANNRTQAVAQAQKLNLL